MQGGGGGVGEGGRGVECGYAGKITVLWGISMKPRHRFPFFMSAVSEDNL